MKRSDFKTDADYYRHHRECFELALVRGCTPREAEAILSRRRVAAMKRELKAIMEPPLVPGYVPQFEDFDCPHMMRN